MKLKKHGTTTIFGVLVLLSALLLAACQPAPTPVPPPGATPTPAAARLVTVFSLWGGSEMEAFLKVLDGFTAATGIPTQYETGRDFEVILRPRIAAGNPPDVAIIPRPGAMAAFAREGAILPLEDLVGRELLEQNYSQAWIDLGTVDGQIYGLAAKANSKATVWYSPARFEANGWEVPETWDELLALMEEIKADGFTPFAIGAKDGWTLTDWWEMITLKGFGPELYDQIVNHEIPWTDPQVKATFETFGDIIRDPANIAGRPEGALGTGFVDGIGLVFGPNPTAEMYYEGGFVGGIALGEVNPDLVIGETIDFFDFPSIDPQYAKSATGGGDLAVVFRDRPEVREFMRYLASKEAGEIWAATGAIVSPNRTVDLGVYPNELAAKEAQQLGGAEIFRFDGSDLMPSGIGGDQLFTALQQYLADPGDLDAVLDELEARAQLEY